MTHLIVLYSKKKLSAVLHSGSAFVINSLLVELLQAMSME